MKLDAVLALILALHRCGIASLTLQTSYLIRPG